MSLPCAVPAVVTGRRTLRTLRCAGSLVRFAQSKLKRAQVTSAPWGKPGSRRHGLCWKRPTAHGTESSWFAQIRHIVRHKTGRWKRQRAARQRGTPRDPAAAVLCSHNVLLSYGRGSTGRAVTPPAAPTAQLEKDGRARKDVCRFAGEHDAGGFAAAWNRGERRGWFESFAPRATSRVVCRQ